MVSHNRRKFMQQAAVATAGVGVLAGCLAETDDDDDDTGNGDDAGNGNGADDYPTQAIDMVIPFGEGGGTDVFARTVANAAQEFLGQSFSFDNEAGAGGLNGTQTVHAADPDGYTMTAFNPPSTPTAWLIQQPPFEIGELEGVAIIGRFPYIITANADYEVEGFGDLMDRFEDGEFSDIAGQGIGTMVDVVARVLRDDVGLEWDDYIAYDGGGEVTEAIMSDEVSIGIGTDSGALSGVDEGRMDTVACIPSGGSAVFPDLESIAEQGYAEEGDTIDTLGMLQPCYWMPPGTDRDRIDVVSAAVEEAIQTEEVQDFAEESGNVIEYSGPDEANALMEDVLETVPEVVDLDAIREDAE